MRKYFNRREQKLNEETHFKYGKCGSHGKKVKLMVICKHLFEHKTKEYVLRYGDFARCKECMKIPSEHLNPDNFFTVCESCFTNLISK